MLVMPKLTWLDDDCLYDAVGKLLNIAELSLEKSEIYFNKNVLDPFSALFQISGFKISHEEWLIAEKTRQAQKSLQNHIGDFHQIILGGVADWDNLKTGGIIDIVNHSQKIIAEVKNKYNTVKGSDLSNLYRDLGNLVDTKYSNYKGYTAYYVTIIPRQPRRSNEPFCPSDKEKGAKCPPNDLIRIIDGASFYEVVTGKKSALYELYSVLPDVIEDLLNSAISEEDKEALNNYFHSAYGTIEFL